MATDAATLTIGIVVSVIAITLLVAIIYRCTWHTGSDDTQSHVHLLAGDKEGGDDDVRYTVQRKLGDGTYGTVYLAKRKSDGQLVAIKVVPCSSDRQSREALNEYQACQTLQGHPNVVKLLDMFEDVPMPSRKAGSIYGALGYSSTILTHLRIAVSKTSAVFVCTVHEYYPHGTLFDLLVKRRAGIMEELVWDYTKQLLSSLIFMHSNNLLHRDIKPSNILVSSDEQRLAVTDFGLARETALHEYAKTKIGTYHYMAPEQIEQQRYNAKADVWSVGCVTYALCTAKVATRDAVVMFMARKSPDFEDRFTKELLGLGYSSKLAQFIMKLLAEDPQRRPASDEALQLLKQLTEVPEAATATATTSVAVVP